ncbi:MAG: Sua5/YciO/YrdC/YwlC family protein [Neisseriaceae bacterium]|nr:MAG: Sua5/YciO/YrdC/YwlC family protein [Neisseriaceae bacterium]
MHQRIPQKKIKQAKFHLKRGGIIAYTTESCFGLGVLPNHPKAVSRLIKLKKRPVNKGLIVIGSTIKQLSSLINPLSASELDFLNNTWPSANTFLVPACPTIFPLLRGTQRKKLAIRIPDHAQALFLCRQIQSALVSTSANIAHKKPCVTFREINRQFGGRVLVISGSIGKYKKSSQIFDLATLKKIR